MDAIDMRGVCLRRGGREILRNIDWRAAAGSNWAVIGANGSGKTTLLQIAGGILFPSAGTVTVLGCRFGAADLFRLRRRVGWMSSALDARMPRSESALDAVISGIGATFGLVRSHAPEDVEKAAASLALVGMADRADAPFGVLSQGERQKVLFARSLMASPEMLVLDEPCSGLDLRAREEFLAAVDAFMVRGLGSVIMVTHRVEEMPPGIANVLVLKDGAVLAAGSAADVLTDETLSDAFSVGVSVHRENGRFWVRTAARGR